MYLKFRNGTFSFKLRTCDVDVHILTYRNCIHHPTKLKKRLHTKWVKRLTAE